MKVIHNTAARRFEAISKYAERAIPSGAGFEWDKHANRWHTESVAKALQLKQYMTPETLAVLGKVEADAVAAAEAAETIKQEKLAASRATDADIEIPAPDGLSYLPFQKAGISYMRGLKDSLCGDEMGLGKTIQALGVVNLTTPKTVLIIAPAYLKVNWLREAMKWLVGDYKVTVMESCGKTKANPEGIKFDATANVVIVNYDIISKPAVVKFIHSKVWGLLVCDECHYLKTSKAIRTKYVLGYKDRDDASNDVEGIRAERRIFATGTPLLNRPSELWGLVRACGLFTNWYKYHTRYCAAYRNGFGWDTSGADNLDELQEKLRLGFMIRRRKADVLPELPAKRHQVLEIEPSSPEQKACVRAETVAKAKIESQTEKLKAAVAKAEVEGGKAGASYQAAVAALKVGRLAGFTELSKLRHDTALAKVDVVAEHALAAGEEGAPIIVFSHHRDVAERLFESLGGREKAVLVYGGMSQEARQAAVDRFQRGDAQYFCGTMRGAGVGITLTRSAHVIFAETDWTPALLAQAEDRAHRIGQEESVLIQHVVLEGSLDAAMARRVVDKQIVLSAALDDITENSGAEEE